MITYRQLKARKKWISLIKSERHITIAAFLRRLKVIKDSHYMEFLNQAYIICREHQRKEMHHSYGEERPRWGRIVNIKPTKARR